MAFRDLFDHVDADPLGEAVGEERRTAPEQSESKPPLVLPSTASDPAVEHRNNPAPRPSHVENDPAVADEALRFWSVLDEVLPGRALDDLDLLTGGASGGRGIGGSPSDDAGGGGASHGAGGRAGMDSP
ncbi:MAG: hypothetical protein N2C14_24990 [Planctomycetales bacterium]